MSEITFNLTRQEAELVINAVAQLPYIQSAKLIDTLQNQARVSLEESGGTVETASAAE